MNRDEHGDGGRRWQWHKQLRPPSRLDSAFQLADNRVRFPTLQTDRQTCSLWTQVLVLLQRGVIQAGLDNLVAEAPEVIDLEVA